MTNYEPLIGKAAESVRLATARTCVWEGSVRSGKTVASLYNWLRYCRQGPSGDLCIATKTERTFRNNLLGPMMEMVGPSRCRWVQGKGELTLLGRKVIVVGANDERAGEKIQGSTLAGAYVDEMTILPESFWNMLDSRLSVAGAQLFATTNPSGPAHWAKAIIDRAALHLTGDGKVLQREIDPDDPDGVIDLHRFTFLLDRDNPILLRDNPEYIANMRRNYTGLWRKRYLEGQWVAADGAVFEMLDEDVHTAPAPPRVGRCWLGIDFGMANPTGAVLLAETEHKGKARLHAISEYRYSGKTNGALVVSELSKQLKAWHDALPFLYHSMSVVVDPSALVLITQLRADGWRVEGAKHDVLPGIQAMANLFNQELLVIDKDRCPWLWKELQGYVWDPKRQAQGIDAPKKVDDHQVDAARYSTLAAWPAWRHWIAAPSQLAAVA